MTIKAKPVFSSFHFFTLLNGASQLSAFLKSSKSVHAVSAKTKTANLLLGRTLRACLLGAFDTELLQKPAHSKLLNSKGDLAMVYRQ
jgi:hypothetical protein